MDPKLYFWDVEVDTVSYFNFETGRGEQDDFPPEQIEGLQVDSNDAERYIYKEISLSFTNLSILLFKWKILDVKYLTGQEGKVL